MLFKINRTRYGGYIVHLGVMIMFVGFIGKAFDKEANISIYFGIFTGIAMLLAMLSVLTLLPKLILTFKPFKNV